MSRRWLAVLLAACCLVPAGVSGPAARAASLPYSRFWRIPDRLGGGIEGYASTTSVRVGGRFALYVSTPARSFAVRAFRTGWYDGRLGEQTWLSPQAVGRLQPAPSLLLPATRTYTAHWHRSLEIETGGWQPGDYLLRLEASSGHMSFVPITVRAPSAAGKVVLISPVTTWQAYNLWGCCDLYQGRDGSFATRSRAVTFDRPYLNENGAGQFIRDELGVVAEADRLGLALDFVSDVDLQQRPAVLRGARAVVSMGHDEYWSPRMRLALNAARARGTNLAFFGANAIFRRVRFGPTPVGPDRLEINYKIAAEDPLDGIDNAAVTADWPSPPDARPESSLLGDQYGCFFGRAPNLSGMVTRPSNWMYRGAGVFAGERLPHLIGPEVDAIVPGFPAPAPIISILHSPTACAWPAYADASYYTAASGAAVFDAGTINWACEVGPTCGGVLYPRTHAVVRQVTDNILRVFARGPAGRLHPA